MKNWEKELSEMNVEELNELKNLIDKIISEKRRKETEKVYFFKFEAQNDPRKGIPFVAKLSVVDGKVEREFYNLHKTYGKKMVTVFGTVKVQEGDVIEVRTGGSWKNDYRSWYYVKDGNMYLVAEIARSQSLFI